MSLLENKELVEFRGVLRKFFDARLPAEAVTALVPQTGDALQGHTARLPDNERSKLWAELGELGGFSAPLPEAYDGLEFGIASAAMLLEESARNLSPLPILETFALGAFPLLLLMSAKKPPTRGKELLQAVGSGQLSLSGGFAYGEPGALRAAKKGKVWKLDGILSLVPSALEVDALIVEALTPEPRWFLLQSSELKAQATPVATFDLLRPFYRLELSATKAELLTEDPVAVQTREQAQDSAALLFSSEMLGALERAFALTLEYTKDRRQFGVPIGSFQALQHGLAECYSDIEQGKALARLAAWSFDNSHTQTSAATRSLWTFIAGRSVALMERMVQFHGGIGFTYEYALHLYLRRMLTLSRAFGGPEHAALNLGKFLLKSQGE